MAVANPKIEYLATEGSRGDNHVIIVSDRSFDDIVRECQREEEPHEELVNAYALYRQRIISSAR